MTNIEKLQWILNHGGNCSTRDTGREFFCSTCPIYDVCCSHGSIDTSEITVERATRCMEKIQQNLHTHDAVRQQVLDSVTQDTQQHNPVNHPSHYTQGGIECIDGIKSALTEEEFRGFCKGNVLKYVWRERNKNGKEDLAKAQFYLNKLLSTYEVPK